MAVSSLFRAGLCTLPGWSCSTRGLRDLCRQRRAGRLRRVGQSLRQPTAPERERPARRSLPEPPAATNIGVPSVGKAVGGGLNLSSSVLAVHILSDGSDQQRSLDKSETDLKGAEMYRYAGLVVAVSTADRRCGLWSPQAHAGPQADVPTAVSDGSLLLLRGGDRDSRRPVFCFLSDVTHDGAIGSCMLLAGAYEKEVVAWEVTRGADGGPITASELSVGMTNHTGWVRSMATPVDAGRPNVLIFSCACNFIKVWLTDWQSPPSVHHIGDLQIFRGDILALCCHNDTILYAASADGKLYAWDILPDDSRLCRWECLCQPQAHEGRVCGLAASARWLFSAALDGKVKVWAHFSPFTAQAARAVHEVSISSVGHAPVVRVLPANLSGISTTILTGSDAGEVALWLIQGSGEAVKAGRLPDMPGAVKAIDCVPCSQGAPGLGTDCAVVMGDDRGNVQMHTISQTLDGQYSWV